MVHLENVPKDSLPIITNSFVSRLRSHAGKRRVPLGARVTFGNSFARWMLGVDKITSLKGSESPDLLDLCEPLESWHHQIRVDRKAVAFLHGRSTDSAQCALFDSEVYARRIDEALKQIKKNAGGDALVRLLEVPAHHVVALWIVDEKLGTSHVRLIDAPFKFDPTILRSRDFLQTLRNRAPIIGIHAKTPKKPEKT